MKDFYDVWVLARTFEFERMTLCQAIQATFKRRTTALPTEPPLALTPEFGTDAAKIRQCEAFIKKSKLDVAGTALEQVCAALQGLLMPPTQALSANEPFEKRWPPSGRGAC